jgi:hypothetical protein
VYKLYSNNEQATMNKGVGMEGVLATRSRGDVVSHERRPRALLAAAGISFLLSVSLWFSGNELQGIFVGLWVPSILSLGAVVSTQGGRP